MPEPLVLTSLRAATMLGEAYGLIEDAAIVLEAGKIAWIGPRLSLDPTFAAMPQRDMGGRLVTPALIDCHTHVVHGANRAVAFEMRLKRWRGRAAALSRPSRPRALRPRPS